MQPLFCSTGLLVIVALLFATTSVLAQLPLPANSVWRPTTPIVNAGSPGAVSGFATITENLTPVGPVVSAYVSSLSVKLWSYVYSLRFWQPQLSVSYNPQTQFSFPNSDVLSQAEAVAGPPLVFLTPAAGAHPRIGVAVASQLTWNPAVRSGYVSLLYTNKTGQLLNFTQVGCYPAEPVPFPVPTPPTGCSDSFHRNGAQSSIATDGNGLVAFSMGVHNGMEHVKVVEQLGDGAKTREKWLWNFTAPPGANNQQSFISDIVIQNEVAIFSHLSTVYFYSLQSGKLMHTETDPCGFRITSASSVTFNTVSIPGTHGTAREKSDLTLVIVNTTHQHGPNTFGVCAYASVQSTTHKHVTKRFSTLLTNTTRVVFTELISDGGSTGEDGVLLLSLWNPVGKASLRGYSTRSGNMLFNLAREAQYGILAYPYDLSAAGGANARLFVTNVMSTSGSGMQFALVDAGTGRALAKCTETCMVFSVVKGNGGRNIVICQLYGKQVLRGIYFDRSVAGTQCVALWEKSIPTKSAIVGISSEAGEYSTPGGVAQKFVTVVMKDGSTLSVTPDAA